MNENHLLVPRASDFCFISILIVSLTLNCMDSSDMGKFVLF